MNTANKKTCAFMLDRDVAAAIDKVAKRNRMSKSTWVNTTLAGMLIAYGELPVERKEPTPGKAGRPKKGKGDK